MIHNPTTLVRACTIAAIGVGTVALTSCSPAGAPRDPRRSFSPAPTTQPATRSPRTSARVARSTTPPKRPRKNSTTPTRANGDPAYPDAWLRDDVADYDCADGSGEGHRYVDGPIKVRPADPFDLDRDDDGAGCDD